MATILLGSGGGPPATPGWLVFPHLDKVVHFLTFGLVATAVYRALPLWVKPGRAILYAVVITSLFGLADEVRQSFNPLRHMDYVDWLADTCGAALAVFVYSRWPFYRKLLESKFNPLRFCHGRTSRQTRSGFAANYRSAR